MKIPSKHRKINHETVHDSKQSSCSISREKIMTYFMYYLVFTAIHFILYLNFVSPLGQWTHQCHCVNSPTFWLGAVFALALKVKWRTCTSLYFVLTTKVIVLEDDTSKYVKFSPSLTFQGSSNISTLTASTVFHSSELWQYFYYDGI